MEKGVIPIKAIEAALAESKKAISNLNTDDDKGSEKIRCINERMKSFHEGQMELCNLLIKIYGDNEA